MDTAASASGSVSSPLLVASTAVVVEPAQLDYLNFLNSQIDALVQKEREKRNSALEKAGELAVAIDFCKQHLVDAPEESGSGLTNDSKTPENRQQRQQRRCVVMAKLVELKLELEYLKERRSNGKEMDEVAKVRGHEFALQSTSGRNPYCEVCLSTIWRLAQGWRKCTFCGFRTHDKCINRVRRQCARVLLAQPGFSLILKFSTEFTLPQQNWQCAECHSPIGFDEDRSMEPRLCHYTNQYYCVRCHWNDELVIPARLVRNWDAAPRPVCRASKQLLSCVQNKPLIDVRAENAGLFKCVGALARMGELRATILLMKTYFVCCRRARRMRILQYLNRYLHFVETDSLYSVEDLVQLAGGKLLPDIETIVRIFRQHITEECEICQGNAFICELCDSNEVIYPFTDGVSICAHCQAVFHRSCFDLKSQRCTRCARRMTRKQAVDARSINSTNAQPGEVAEK